MLPRVSHVCVGTITHALGAGKVTDMALVTFVETQNGRSRAALNHQRQEQSHLSAPITSRKRFKWGKTKGIVWRLRKPLQITPQGQLLLFPPPTASAVGKEQEQLSPWGERLKTTGEVWDLLHPSCHIFICCHDNTDISPWWEVLLL